MNVIQALTQVSVTAAEQGEALVALVAAADAEMEAMAADASASGTKIAPESLSVRLLVEPGDSADEVITGYARALRSAGKISGELQDWKHLSSLALPHDDDVEALETGLLGGLEVHEHAREHAIYSALLQRAAGGLRAAGSEEDAFRAAYRADLAILRSHLVKVSVLSGDWSLVVSEVRWRAVMVALAGLELPGDIPGAVAAVRARIEMVCPLASGQAIAWPELTAPSTRGRRR